MNTERGWQNKSSSRSQVYSLWPPCERDKESTSIPFYFQKMELTSAPLFLLPPGLGVKMGMFSSRWKLLPSWTLKISCFTWAVCVSGAWQTENIPFSGLCHSRFVLWRRCVIMMWPQFLRPSRPQAQWKGGCPGWIRTLVWEGITGHQGWKK